MKRLLGILGAITMLIVGAPSASAVGDGGSSTIKVTAVAHLDGSQEVPAVDTKMSGSTWVRVREDRLRFKINVWNNSSTVLAIHIHCGEPGTNGPVGVTLFSGAFDGDGTVARGALHAPDDANACGWGDLGDVAGAIAGGAAYINVHTSKVLSGEVRGDLYAKRVRLKAEAKGDGSQEVPAVDTKMTAKVRIVVRDHLIRYKVSVAGNTSEVLAIHIHCGAPGANGPVGVTLFSGSFAGDGTVVRSLAYGPDHGNACGWTTSGDVAEAITAGAAYINIHTSKVPPGEVRADLS